MAFVSVRARSPPSGGGSHFAHPSPWISGRTIVGLEKVNPISQSCFFASATHSPPRLAFTTAPLVPEISSAERGHGDGQSRNVVAQWIAPILPA